MRPLPILTAILVAGFLYLLVIERDALMAFARGEDPVAARDAAKQKQDATPLPPAESKLIKTNAVGVIAIHSSARKIDSAVVLRGQTEAARQVDARAETSGLVISDPLRKGAFVQTGDVLCRLDPGIRNARMTEAKARHSEAKARLPEAEAQFPKAQAQLETSKAQLETAGAQLETAKAQMASAQASLDEAEINYKAANKLFKGGYASETRVASAQAVMRAAEAGITQAKAGVTQARAGVTSAKAGVKSSEAGLKSAQAGILNSKAGIDAAAAAVASAQKEIDRLAIHAPFEGLLETDTAELGSLMQPGGKCATIIQLDPIKVVGFVPETEIAKVAVGAKAGARLSTGQQMIGRITFLSRSADPKTRTFRVELELPNKGLQIRDGQTAEILIASDGTLAHLIPQSALTLSDKGILGVRVVDKDSNAQFTPVTLMRDTKDGVWVSGLPEKADIIVIGQEYVVAGVPVKATYQSADPAANKGDDQ